MAALNNRCHFTSQHTGHSPPCSPSDGSCGKQRLLHGCGAHFSLSRCPPHKDFPPAPSRGSELQRPFSAGQMGSCGGLGTLGSIQLHWGPRASGTFQDIWREAPGHGGSCSHLSLSSGELHREAVAGPALGGRVGPKPRPLADLPVAPADMTVPLSLKRAQGLGWGAGGSSRAPPCGAHKLSSRKSFLQRTDDKCCVEIGRPSQATGCDKGHRGAP